MQFRQEGDQVLQAAAEPIDRPDHDHVEIPARCSAAQRVEGRALVATFGAADTVILVDLDDIATHTIGDLAQLALLIGRGLVLPAETKVEDGAFHWKPLVSMPRETTKSYDKTSVIPYD